MPSTTPATLKRRRTEDALKGKPKKVKKHVKRQKFYHSSSEDEEEVPGAARDAPRDSSEEREQERKEKGSMANAIPLGERGAAKPRTKPQPILKKKPARKVSPLPAPVEPIESTEPVEAVQDDEDEEEAVLGALEEDSEPDAEELKDEFDDSDDSESSSLSETSTNPSRKVKKRNDPEAFATSISKILNTKLTTQKRSEPILSRSKSAQDTNKSIADAKLTQKAQRQVLAERQAAKEKGRVKDVLGLNDPSTSTAATTAQEKELRRTAQKGVIKLFNAVRAAQVKGEQAEKEARENGLVGLAKREEKVKEMSKQGFLDMITGGTKKKEGSVEA